MLNNLSNNNSGNATKSVVEKKHYEDIEKRLDEMQDEIEMTEQGVSTNSQAIASLDERVGAVEDNSTFPTLNTDTINPATGDKVEITSDLDVDGEVEANSVKTDSLSVNGTSFETVKDNAAQAKTTAENAKNKADEAYDLADALSDELAAYKADNEQSITTGTLDADSVTTDSIAAQTINTNDFETTNAEIDKLYVDTIKATGFLELPTVGQSHYTITVPAKTTASFSGVYTSSNNTDYPFYFTVSDGAVIYKQGSTEIIKDISFDRETGNTKVRVKSSTNLTYISSALDSNPVTIEDGGDAYVDYVFIPQKTGGYLIRGYDDTTTEIYIAGVLKAYAMSVEEEIIERTSVDFLKVNASIELPKEWDAGGTISYSTGEENQYISAQTKAGVTKPTWTSPIHSTIGSLSYSSKLVDEATVASYKGISETRQTETISITNEASLQQLTAFHWTKNGNYWQPYELTRITIGDNTMWIDPTEANQGIRFSDNQVIADGTWNDVPVEEANAVPVNLVIFDAPTELSFPITNLGDKTTVHGEITATCFKGNVLGNVTGNADTATNATCFDGKTYAEAKADILSGKASEAGTADLATNAICFDGKTYAEACADILTGNAASATNASNADKFNNMDYATVKADILTGCAADSDKFNGKTYAEACADILTGKSATSGTADSANTVKRSTSSSSSAIPVVLTDAATAVNNGQVLVDSDNHLTYTPSTDTLCTGNVEATTDVKAANVCGSSLVKGAALCSTGDLNVDGNAYITGDLTVQGTITTTHSEEVVTPSENIILRDGATTPIASGCYSGMTITNYDGQNNNLEVGVDNEGTLKIGTSSANMEAVATRTCSDCMESCYAAKWDATDKQLETKGVTCTHDLCVNGNATITGTLTADLTGTADNATCFDGKTYSQAKSDILTGCAADSAKLGNKAASCYIDNSSTAQTKAGNLSIGAPAACTTTSAGGTGNILGSTGIDIYGSNSLPHIHFHNNKYCGEYSARIANTTGRVALTVNNGTGCTEATESKIFDFCSDGTFKGATNICGTNIYQNGNKVIDASSTAQTKAGSLSIGAPTACTTTSAGGNGLLMNSLGTISLYKEGTPYIDFHYDRYCGGYSSRICSSYTSSDCRGSLDITVNNGKGCTTCTECSVYCFKSDGTFTGACTICANNIYSAGCPVVTTGTLPTVAPGYNCTGTSNYVVTTMVCCACHAKTIDRIACGNNYNWHIPLTCANITATCTTYAVSSACPLTYNPATGVLKACTVCAENTNTVRSKIYSAAHSAYSLIATTKVSSGIVDYVSMNVTIFSANATNSYPIGNIAIDFSSGVSSNTWNIQGFTDIDIYNGNNANYPRIVVSKDAENYNIYVQSSYTYERLKVEYKSAGSSVIPDIITDTDSPSGTIVFDSSTDKTKIAYVKNVPSAMSVSNTPTSASTVCNVTITAGCCSASAPTNYTWCFCGCNGSIYSPNSIYIGSGGGRYAAGSSELFAPSPFVDFHYNCYCGDYSSRLINGSQGLTQLIVNNGTGTTTATESTTYCFCSNGTFSGACTVITACTCTMCVNGYNAGTNNHADLKFQATCCDATTRCNWNMCLCGSDGKLYNPQGFVGDITVNMNCVTNATSVNVAANTITRKTIVRNQITGVGYVTSAAIGLCRGTTSWGQALLSVSYNDAGTAWKDYCFNYTGRISANGLTLHNNGGINTGVYMKVGTASCNADRNIMFTPAVPGSDDTSTGEVQVSTGCPLTFNPATGVLCATCFCGNLNATCVKVGQSLIKGYTGSTVSNVPTMIINDCCFQVYYDRSSQSLPNLQMVEVETDRVGIGSRSCVAGRYSVALGGYSKACCQSVAIGYGAEAPDYSIAIGTYVYLCTGDSYANCIRSVVMAPGASHNNILPTHPFGCARIMVYSGTPQCTMFSFLKCLFQGRSGNGIYAYASNIAQGNCTGCITSFDSQTYSLSREDSGHKFELSGLWSACCSCSAVIPVSNTDGYFSFDLVW